MNNHSSLHSKESKFLTSGIAGVTMPPPVEQYFREARSGTAVVCIHSSASTSGQWRALSERLADRFRVIAVDLYGSGKTAAWPLDQPMRLDDELALLSSMLRAAGDRFHLVGHSYGGQPIGQTVPELTNCDNTFRTRVFRIL